MKRPILGPILVSCACSPAFGQATEAAPKFEIADVQVSAKPTGSMGMGMNQFARTGPVRGGRYEVKTASMVDLIRIAYGFDMDKILGGPSWMEMDRFDVIAKVPTESTPETQKLMLQSLLEDRFKLKTHKENKPLPTYALTVGKKPQLKEADGSEETGCRPQTTSGNVPVPEGGARIMMGSVNGGAPMTISLGPGMTISYMCRNMTMEAFARGMRGMLGASVGPNPVLDETGLKGNWNFDLRFSIQLNGGPGTQGDRISIMEAVDKQLGLKMDEKQIPTPVIVVDSVERKPTDNPPGVAEALPAIPAPTEFEVASIKPADPSVRMQRFQTLPGGRVIVDGMPLRFLIYRAFNTNNNEQVAEIPKFAETDRYDIVAKAPSTGSASAQIDMEAAAPMMRSLLEERFKMKYHTEERPVTAYSLVVAKPKMKKADPNSRTSCKYGQAPAGSGPGSQVYICQNITTTQFAERLQNMSPELSWPVSDGTGLEGGWDFTLNYSRMAGMAMGPVGGRGGGDAGGAGPAMASASDPTGGYTIFEALEKQLGLKLEKQKHNMPVVVIDHLEQKPTEN